MSQILNEKPNEFVNRQLIEIIFNLSHCKSIYKFYIFKN